MKNIIRLWLICVLVLYSADSAVAFEFGESLDRVDIHGFISQGYLLSEGNNFYAGTEDGTFQFNEVGLNVSAELTDRLHTSIQLLSRDIGDIGNNELQVDLAYADYRWKDWLGFRVGKVKVNYGLYNETRDVDMLRTSVLLPQGIYPEALRDMYHSLYGIEIYGNISLGRLGCLTYQWQTGQKNISSESGMAKFFEGELLDTEYKVNRFEMQDIGNLSLDWDTFVDGLHFKLWAGAYTLEAVVENRYELSGEEESLPAGTEFRMEFEERFRGILSSEYVNERMVLAAEIQIEGDEQDTSVNLYAGGTLNLKDWWQIGAYYAAEYSSELAPFEGAYINEEEEAVPNETPDYTELVLTTRFDLNEQWTLKVEGHFVEGSDVFLAPDNPDDIKEESSLLAVKTTFHF